MTDEELFDLYILDALSDLEAHELNRRINHDPSVATALVHYLNDTASFVAVAQLLEAQNPSPVLTLLPSEDEAKPHQPGVWAAIRRHPVLIGAVAAVLVVTLSLLYSGLTQTPAHSYAVQQSSSPLFEPGESLLDKTTTISANTTVTLVNSNGTTAHFIGPATFQLQSDKIIQLSQGCSTITVAEKDHGLRVVTPHGTITDLGTAFGTRVDSHSTEVHVFEGSVVIDDTQDVFEFEAYSMQKNQAPKMIPYEPESFGETNQAPLKILNGERQFITLNRSVDEFEAKLTAPNLNQYPLDCNLLFSIKADGQTLFKKNLDPSFTSTTIQLGELSQYRELELRLKPLKGETRGLYVQLEEAQSSGKATPKYPQNLIKEGELWSYYNEVSAPPKDWINDPKISNNWPRSHAPFGFGSDVATRLEERKNPLYLKHSFTLPQQPNKNTTLLLSLLVDDGAVIYLNGKELQRVNLEEGQINHETRAPVRISGDLDEFTTYEIPATLLEPGENVISAILFQYRKSSSDTLFDLKMVLKNNPEGP